MYARKDGSARSSFRASMDIRMVGRFVFFVVVVVSIASVGFPLVVVVVAVVETEQQHKDNRRSSIAVFVCIFVVSFRFI